jgi:hypothetical protein
LFYRCYPLFQVLDFPAFEDIFDNVFTRQPPQLLGLGAVRLCSPHVEKKTLLPLELTLKHKTTGIVAKATHQKSPKNT